MVVRKYIVDSGWGDPVTYEVDDQEGGMFIAVRREGDEEWHQVSLSSAGESGLFLLNIDERSRELYLERDRSGIRATVDRHVFECEVVPWTPAGTRRKRSRRSAGVREITAPMTGSVVEVYCKGGDQVPQGEVLMVIESMKMNNEIRAPRDVTIEDIPVEAGDRVGAGDVLVRFADGA